MLIATITPDLYIGYFRELSNQPPGQLDPAVAGQIMARYATDLIPRTPLPGQAPAAQTFSDSTRERVESRLRLHILPDIGSSKGLGS